MRDRHCDTVDVAFAHGFDAFLRQVCDDLVAVEIEVDPGIAAAAFSAAQDLSVEPSRFGEVVNRKCQVTYLLVRPEGNTVH